MAGNICRCGTYVRIREAIKSAAGDGVRRPSCRQRTPPFRVGLSCKAALPAAWCWPFSGRCAQRPSTSRNSLPTIPDGQFAPNAFIRIDNAGKTTLVIPQAEMGQGVYTAIAMILAEELDADFAQVVIEHAPASDKLYANPLFGIQVTGNSNSIRSFWDKLREAGAAARAMLIAAAAAQWQVDAASCSASNGKVTHAASNRTLTYGELADAAGKLPVPDKPKLKDPKDFTLIGKPLKRHDTPDKSDGKTIYGIDAMVPDMKFATLAQCPVLGGKVKHVDDSAAKKLPGVRQVVVLDDLVAVVGDHMWAAWQGLDALKVTWDEGPNAKINSADIWNELRAASKKDGVVAKSEGDVDKGLTQGERFDADYELPFLAHATLGAAELHGAPDAGRLRDLDRHASAEPGAGICGQGRGPPDRQGDGLQPLHRRRLRPPARAGHGRERGAHRQRGFRRRSRSCGRAKRTCSTTSTGRPIATRFRLPCRTARSSPGNTGDRLVDHRALVAARIPEGHRRRRRR